MAGGSGYSHKALEAARSKVENELKNLNNILSKIQKDVNKMNQDVWYGGKTANIWYEAMEKAFTKDVNYYNKVVTLQNNFSKRLTNSKSKTSKGSSGISGSVDQSPNSPINVSPGSVEVQPGGDWQGNFEWEL